MPHLWLEYSSSLPDDIDWQSVMVQLHRALLTLDLFRVEDLKSRAIRLEHVLAGDGSLTTAFVHLTVNILSGRETGVRHAISHCCLEVLTEQLTPAVGPLRVDITVDVREMDRQSYAKMVLNPAG